MRCGIKTLHTRLGFCFSIEIHWIWTILFRRTSTRHWIYQANVLLMLMIYYLKIDIIIANRNWNKQTSGGKLWFSFIFCFSFTLFSLSLSINMSFIDHHVVWVCLFFFVDHTNKYTLSLNKTHTQKNVHMPKKKFGWKYCIFDKNWRRRQKASEKKGRSNKNAGQNKNR